MKKYIYTNCALINKSMFLIDHTKGMPAIMYPDKKIELYDRMYGFSGKEGTIVDFMDSFQNKVYVLGSKENALTIFDLEKYECRHIPLACSCQPWANFVAFERYGSDYYIFPKYENKIFILDVKKEKIKEIRNHSDYGNEIQCACRAKDSVCILPKSVENIFYFNLSNGEEKVYKRERKTEDCVHAFFDGEYIFFLNKYGIIYRWDMNKEKLQEITVFETEHSDKESMSRIIRAGNRLILLPGRGNNIKILDLLTEKTEIYHDYPRDMFFQPENNKFYGYCEDETSYIFAQCFGNYFLRIDKQSGQFVWVKPDIELVGKYYIEQEFLKNQVIYEKTFELTDLLKVIRFNKHLSDHAFAGEEIYRMMKI